MTATIPPPPSQEQQATPSTPEMVATKPLPPSALTTLLSSTTTPPPTPLSANTLQILHNLQHQHLWTSLRVHNLHLPSNSEQQQPLYLISGIPPHHLYIHPDEQLFMLERGLREDDVELERMFVLPTVQGESWTLRKLAGVFDSLPEGSGEGEVLEGGGGAGEKAEKLREYYEYRGKARATKEWGGKRLLLAMVDRRMGGDGTVVYYVVQDGAVKPRQN
ncbi:hypothetical protein BO85DRAFT_89499 [Aspergillus piperis CBS 112811]|uniref:tRNA-splicing endonuclease subunit Sen15 domain-containing protein n=1 Tax=Aspergillus piperis CBS 112811 TaxID=1448313 RepID=A0A8G1VJT1_9EURO|nr:hypothetical protein BO85DRAFT_89499 [Aspergillus piperis CBS 112811]RAH54995.1 hypothetical protein BO85DRAFT_89499 [Aspergillus piperis CBS 112811]